MTFTGKGMFLTLQVAHAAAELDHRFERDGVAMEYALQDEPWGSGDSRS